MFENIVYTQELSGDTTTSTRYQEVFTSVRPTWIQSLPKHQTEVIATGLTAGASWKKKHPNVGTNISGEICFHGVFSTSPVRPRPPIRFVWILMALQQASLEVSGQRRKRWFVQDCSSSQRYRHYSSPHSWLDWADCIPCSSNSALSENTKASKVSKSCILFDPISQIPHDSLFAPRLLEQILQESTMLLVKLLPWHVSWQNPPQKLVLFRENWPSLEKSIRFVAYLFMRFFWRVCDIVCLEV